MKRFLPCSFALVLLYPAGIDMYLVGLPRIAADLNASEAQLHIAFSVYLAGMATAMLFAGKIADQSGRKPVAIVGALVFMMASLLCSRASEGSLFLSGRFLQGVGAGGCYVVAFAILRDTLDEHRRAKVLSLLNGITCIVPVLAPVVGHLIMLRFPGKVCSIRCPRWALLWACYHCLSCARRARQGWLHAIYHDRRPPPSRWLTVFSSVDWRSPPLACR